MRIIHIKEYKAECKSCECTFAHHESEVRRVLNAGDAGYATLKPYVHCPLCNQPIVIDWDGKRNVLDNTSSLLDALRDFVEAEESYRKCTGHTHAGTDGDLLDAAYEKAKAAISQATGKV